MAKAKQKNERIEVGDAVFAGPAAREEARLFRLAPALYASLQETIPFVERLLRQLENSNEPAHVVKKLRATLRQARHVARTVIRGRWVTFNGRTFHAG